MSRWDKELENTIKLKKLTEKSQKAITFRCDPLAPKSMLTLQMHRDANPNGLPLYNGRSRGYKEYFGMYKIHETRTQIIVEEIK